MRIVSKKKDYYDCVQSCSQDRSTVYVRTEEEVYYDLGKWPLPSYPYDYVPGLVNYHIIGFCGRIYPAIEMCATSPESNRTFCYTLTEFNDYVHANLHPKELDIYLGKSKRSPWRWRSVSLRYGFERFYESMNKQMDKYKEMFIAKRAPIFTARQSGRWGGGVITWNGMLRPFDFVRIFDPYSAFQEIQMFMNNLAAPEKEMPVISDELKAQSKGFDKWSFRRPPG